MKQQIDSARESIGRNVTFYTVDKSACPLCLSGNLYDPITDNSFNVFCSVCKGSYWVNVAVGTEVLARVHWISDEGVTATPGGKYYLGDATVTVEKSYLDLAERCQDDGGKVLVDGHSMQISKIIPFGAFDITRYRVILKNMGDRPEKE